MENEYSSICPVKQMIAMLGMSKARFYQHLKNGVFPHPIYCIRTKKPFYPENLQKQCMEIRKTGIGHNGLPVIFYTPLQREHGKSKDKPGRDYREIVEALKNMNIKATNKEIDSALRKLKIPPLAEGPIDSEILKKLFNYFTQRVQSESNLKLIAVSKE